MPFDQILIHGARLHNLQNISLALPKNRLIVFTGLSGSGKSSLAIDTLFKEGQRQYLESLGLIFPDFATKPEVDRIEGLSPSISVDQHLTNRSPRSTVGTATQVFTFLRVLFARIGHRRCPVCGADVPPPYGAGDDTWDNESGEGEVETATVESTPTYPCPSCGAPLPELGMASFSFNKPAGACPTCTGLGEVHRPRLERLVNLDLAIRKGAVTGWDIHLANHYLVSLTAAAQHFGFPLDPDAPVKDWPEAGRDLLYWGAAHPTFLRHFPGIQPPDARHRGLFEGVATILLRRYADHLHDADYRQKLEEMLVVDVCPDCHGARLRPEARQVTVAGRTIVEASALPLDQLTEWLESLFAVITPDEALVVEPVVADLRERARRLVDVGVGYLTLDRASPSLSTGEAQRLRLASLLASGLTGVLYVLDEPTIGLHPRDTNRLIGVLYRLRDLGNTVLVIEHDMEMLRQADWVVDIGPGAGRDGGRIVVTGTPEKTAACAESLTGAYLSGRERIPIPEARRPGNGKFLTVRGAREHNLKDITISFPLGTLTAVTGASGSGKSSLMFDVLDKAARARYFGAAIVPGQHDGIDGWEHLDKIITIDQEQIGRMPRSNAATYTDTFGPIRDLFAAQPAARAHGLSARHFSFNVPGGRCERCQGAGILTVTMQLLPDIPVRCPTCHGRRFRKEVLEVCYKDHDIAQVLELTVAEALALFAGERAVATRLSLLADVGLGYLKLGQPAGTLSGGEAQRVKLSKELARRSSGRTLYLLDEPTTGLHLADTARLLSLLQRLVASGNTVVVVEHNLDLIKAADWVIDLGPEGGTAGGQVVAEGTPEAITANPISLTGHYLQAVLPLQSS